jgi:hypothetical protein
MFNPAVVREMLFKLFLSGRDNSSGFIKDYGSA